MKKRVRFDELSLNEKIRVVKQQLLVLGRQLIRTKNEDESEKLREKVEKGERLYARLVAMQEVTEPHGARACPVCGGKRQAPTRSMFVYGKRTSGQVGDCMTCKGRGWVEEVVNK